MVGFLPNMVLSCRLNHWQKIEPHGTTIPFLGMCFFSEAPQGPTHSKSKGPPNGFWGLCVLEMSLGWVVKTRPHCHIKQRPHSHPNPHDIQVRVKNSLALSAYLPLLPGVTRPACLIWRVRCLRKYEPSQGCCQVFTHVQSVLTSVRPYPAARLARFPDSKKHRFLDFLRHCREIGNMEFQTQENPVRVTFQFPRFFSWTLISVVEIQIYVLFCWNQISVG